MSVKEELKEVYAIAKEITEEEPRLGIVSCYQLVAENYKSVKFFSRESIVLAFEKYDLIISGTNLIIDFFSPARLKLTGTIQSIEYASQEIVREEFSK